MNKLRMSIFMVLLAAMIAAVPVQASRLVAMNFAHHLTFDLVCDSQVVCRIQNASLANLNGNVIWLYQQLQGTSGSVFASRISLELPDGATRGFLSYGLNGGNFAVGMEGEGSLARFQAYGTVIPATPGSMTGTSIFHYDGTYIAH